MAMKGFLSILPRVVAGDSFVGFEISRHGAGDRYWRSRSHHLAVGHPSRQSIRVNAINDDILEASIVCTRLE